MRATVLTDYGGPEMLKVADREAPGPDDGEILVDVEAASVNDIDMIYREGHFSVPELPFVLGRDFAGVVREVGDGVERFDPGDRVFGAKQGSPLPGTYAERVTAPVDNVARLPDGTSFAAGAGVGHVGLTAWRSLVTHGEMVPGDTVLIHGGSGGVGHVAVQLARAAGARVVATAGAPERVDRIAELGADVALEYTRDDIDEAIADAVGDGADVILDGTFDVYAPLNLEVAADDATVSILQYEDSRGVAELPGNLLSPALWKDLTIQLVGGPNADPPSHVLDRLAVLFARDELTVDIEESYSLADVPRAQEKMANEHFVGKLVVEP